MENRVIGRGMESGSFERGKAKGNGIRKLLEGSVLISASLALKPGIGKNPLPVTQGECDI